MLLGQVASATVAESASDSGAVKSAGWSWRAHPSQTHPWHSHTSQELDPHRQSGCSSGRARQTKIDTPLGRAGALVGAGLSLVSPMRHFLLLGPRKRLRTGTPWLRALPRQPSQAPSCPTAASAQECAQQIWRALAVRRALSADRCRAAASPRPASLRGPAADGLPAHAGRCFGSAGRHQLQLAVHHQVGLDQALLVLPAGGPAHDHIHCGALNNGDERH